MLLFSLSRKRKNYRNCKEKLFNYVIIEKDPPSVSSKILLPQKSLQFGGKKVKCMNGLLCTFILKATKNGYNSIVSSAILSGFSVS